MNFKSTYQTPAQFNELIENQINFKLTVLIIKIVTA